MNRCLPGLGAAAAAIACAATLAWPAEALAVEFTFTGHVEAAVLDTKGVAVGDLVTGSWTVDHDATGSCTRSFPGGTPCLDFTYPQTAPSALSLTVQTAAGAVPFAADVTSLVIHQGPTGYSLLGSLTTYPGSFQLGLGFVSGTSPAPFPQPPSSLDGYDGTLQIIIAGTSVGLFRIQLDSIGPSSIPVAIDIKPGSFPNSINLGSQGKTPVAILSAVDFDATQVDPLSVALASAPVKLKGNGSPMASFQDVNGDGLLDLVVHVDTECLDLTAADETATLTGETFAGQAIEGADSVRVVPPE